MKPKAEPPLDTVDDVAKSKMDIACLPFVKRRALSHETTNVDLSLFNRAVTPWRNRDYPLQEIAVNLC